MSNVTLLWDNSDLQNFLLAEYPDALIDASAIKNAIRLLKLAKSRGFDPAKRKDRNDLTGQDNV